MTGTGRLFINDKQGNPKRPDLSGLIEIDGVEYNLAAWREMPKNGSGNKYLSIRLSDKRSLRHFPPDQPSQPATAEPPPDPQMDLIKDDGDYPF